MFHWYYTLKKNKTLLKLKECAYKEKEIPIATTEIYNWIFQQWKIKYKPGEFVQSVFLFVPKLVRPLSWASRFDQELLVKTPYRMQCHASEVVLSAYQPLLSALWSTVMSNKKEKKPLIWIIIISNRI